MHLGTCRVPPCGLGSGCSSCLFDRGTTQAVSATQPYSHSAISYNIETHTGFLSAFRKALGWKPAQTASIVSFSECSAELQP